MNVDRPFRRREKNNVEIFSTSNVSSIISRRRNVCNRDSNTVDYFSNRITRRVGRGDNRAWSVLSDTSPFSFLLIRPQYVYEFCLRKTQWRR